MKRHQIISLKRKQKISEMKMLANIKVKAKLRKFYTKVVMKRN
jgi:hypothetical protein